jgi:hypothetical protein
MNKRIKELAEQAGFIPDNAPGMNPVLEKFAQLIVRECLKVMDQQWNDPHEVYQAMQDIKKHFEIEQ